VSVANGGTGQAWHCLDTVEVAATLRGDLENGLSRSEARARLRDAGPNVLEAAGGRTLAVMFLSQFADFMILVLLAAALISGFIGEAMDTVAIVVILLLNAVIGAAQEYRA
jgi:Ca2+-transporting ATPase